MQEEHPYRAYSLITLTYLLFFGFASMLIRRKRNAQDSPASGADLLLIGIATYRLSRLISSDRVTQYLRLPFVEEGRGTEHVEGTQEEPTGHGLRLAIGQLLTCTYCSSVWAGTFNSALLIRDRLSERSGCQVG